MTSGHSPSMQVPSGPNLYGSPDLSTMSSARATYFPTDSPLSIGQMLNSASSIPVPYERNVDVSNQGAVTTIGGERGHHEKWDSRVDAAPGDRFGGHGAGQGAGVAVRSRRPVAGEDGLGSVGP